jgi:hypothetical protein
MNLIGKMIDGWSIWVSNEDDDDEQEEDEEGLSSQLL